MIIIMIMIMIIIVIMIMIMIMIKIMTMITIMTEIVRVKQKQAFITTPWKQSSVQTYTVTPSYTHTKLKFHSLAQVLTCPAHLWILEKGYIISTIGIDRGGHVKGSYICRHQLLCDCDRVWESTIHRDAIYGTYGDVYLVAR